MRLATGLILTAGCYNLAFAIFHLFFWRLFGWPEQLRKLTPVNAGIMQTLNLCLTYIFLVAALACFFFSPELATTELGRFVLVAFAVFWGTRAIYQPLFFGLSHPLSTALFVVFILGTLLHSAAWWVSRSIAQM